MNCREYRDLRFEAYGAGDPRWDELQEHDCADCRSWSRTADRVSQEIAHAPRAILQAEVEYRVLRHLGPVIERTMKGRRHRWQWGLGLAGAVMVAAAVLVILPGENFLPLPHASDDARRAPILDSGVGHFELVAADGRSVGPSDFGEGHGVHTGADGSVRLRLDLDVVALSRNSALTLDQIDAEAKQVTLHRGRATFFVEPDRRRQRSFMVRAPFATVEVTGTVFVVDAVAETVTTVRGTVRVIRGKETTHVIAGRRWRRGKVSTALNSTLTAAWLDVVPHQPPPPQTTRTDLATQKPRASRRSMSQDGTRPGSPTGGRNRSADLHDDWSRYLFMGDCAAALSMAKTMPATPRRWQRLVDCFLATGDQPGALSALQGLRKLFPDSVAAGNALFEIGRLHEKAGRNQEARESFSDYNRLYPDGSLRAEAHLRTCSIAVSTSQFNDAVVCLSDYRAAYGDGAATASRARAVYLEGRVRMNTKDYSGAIDSFRTYLDSGHKTYREDSLYRYYRCVAVSDPDAAAEVAREYLRSFPGGSHANQIRSLLGDE